MFSKSVLYYGQDAPQPEMQTLRAGPLAIIFEGGMLRSIWMAEHEVLRGIYVAVRDHNWGTIPAKITYERFDIQPDSFQIVYRAEHQQNDIHFAWTGMLVGDSDGTLRFSMAGEALSTFRSNRIGFCVLHPMNLAGVLCEVGHTDGAVQHSKFPVLIEPHQPFKDMAWIAHPVQSGVTAHVAFEGDEFEMEDQRNWTDASYKTYCTPLELPFPFTFQAGMQVRQAVTLTMRGLSGSLVQVAQATDDLMLDVEQLKHTAAYSLPRLGLGFALPPVIPDVRQMERLKALHLDHLRVDLHFGQSSEPGRPSRAFIVASEQARALSISLHVAVYLATSVEHELAALGRWTDELKAPVSAWLIFQQSREVADSACITLARNILAGCSSNTLFVSGTDGWFAQLNRNRPTEPFDALTYSVTPQVHVTDNATLVENLAGQTVTLETAYSFSGGKPVIVSPVTLKMRSNPAATAADPEPAPGTLPAQVDPRQMSLFAAGWLAGSVAAMAAGCAHSVTYFETVGWRGVMDTADGAPAPFPAVPGGVFPLYHVLADIGEFAGGEVFKAPDHMLVLRKGQRLRLLIPSLVPYVQHAMIQGLPTGSTVKYLNETSAQAAMHTPENYRTQPDEPITDGVIDLLPFSIARIDCPLY